MRIQLIQAATYLRVACGIASCHRSRSATWTS